MATHNRQPYQIAVTSVFLALSLPTVLLRLWVRKWMINSLGVDDFMMSVAMLSFAIYNLALMEIVANGGGTHISSGTPGLLKAIEWTTVNEVFYLVTQIFLKLSLGFFFLRVVAQKGFRRFIIATISFSTIVNSYHVLFVIFRCGDPKHLAVNQLEERCVNNKISIALGYEQAAVSTVTDLIFAAMPIPLLWNKSMDFRSKLSAGLILSLGAFGSICSIVRFLYVQTLGFHSDFFWSAVNISIWSTIELGMGIIAGSLATMRPLMKRMVRSTRSHLTLGSSEKKKSTWQSSVSKPQPAYGNMESLPSVFRPWESVGESKGYTTTILGGSDVEKDRKTSMSASRSGNKSIDVLKSADYADRTAIWPFVEDSAGIAKVIDVQVSVSEAIPDIEMQAPTRTYRRSEEGGGLWGLRFEDKIRKPEKERTATSKSPSRSSTPEWERLPDLVTFLDEKGSPRKSSEVNSPAGSSQQPSPKT